MAARIPCHSQPTADAPWRWSHAQQILDQSTLPLNFLVFGGVSAACMRRRSTPRTPTSSAPSQSRHGNDHRRPVVSAVIQHAMAMAASEPSTKCRAAIVSKRAFARCCCPACALSAAGTVPVCPDVRTIPVMARRASSRLVVAAGAEARQKVRVPVTTRRRLRNDSCAYHGQGENLSIAAADVVSCCAGRKPRQPGAAWPRHLQPHDLVDADAQRESHRGAVACHRAQDAARHGRARRPHVDLAHPLPGFNSASGLRACLHANDILAGIC